MLLLAFALWELRNPSPMLELRLFRRRGFSVGAITITVAYLSIFGFQFTAIQYLQSVKGYSALRGGFGVLPISADHRARSHRAPGNSPAGSTRANSSPAGSD